MKKKFSIILIFISIFYANICYSENLIEENELRACSQFYNAVKNDELPNLKGDYPFDKYNDFGFYYKFKWDINTKKWIADKDKNGNLMVGEIYSKSAIKSLKPNDRILKINDKKINNADDFNQEYLNSERIKVELKDKGGEIYLAYLDKEKNEHSKIYYNLIDIAISDIDLKKSVYETTIYHEFVRDYTTVDNNSDELQSYTKLGHKYLMGTLKLSGKKNFFHICRPTEKEFNDSEMNKPHEINTLNLIKNDLDLQKLEFMVIPYKKPRAQYDALRVSTKINSVQVIKNKFNLRSFPFDRQTLQYKIVDDKMMFDQRLIYISEFTFETIEKFMKNDDIPGWKKSSYNLSNIFYRDSLDREGTFHNGLMIEIELERKHGYYIFKVILPIILILVVCWSVVWIDPREIESRLTITIVCLLSLIAYNFVIDEELPKLEYLTVMDWIVLTSYVYATIPNFLSIYSFANISSTKITLKVDDLSKKFGLSSYVLIVLVIIFLNANLNPKNSSALIGWMTL